jgi:carbon storage regulator
MLVLSRKSGQRLVIDDDIVITVLKVRGNQVRIGIEAPASVRIRREEVHELSYAAAADWDNDGVALMLDPRGS